MTPSKAFGTVFLCLRTCLRLSQSNPCCAAHLASTSATTNDAAADAEVISERKPHFPKPFGNLVDNAIFVRQVFGHKRRTETQIPSRIVPWHGRNKFLRY